jgi:diguanylate cyclase (GGDEF)-like protein
VSSRRVIETDGTWLCESAGARQRMLDMDHRLGPVRRLALGALGIAALAQGPWLGWWTVVPLFAAAGVFAIAARVSEGSDRPEYILFGAFVGSEVVIVATIVIAQEPLLLPWLVLPVVTLPARFSLHGLAAGVGVAFGCMVAAALLSDADGVSAYPPELIAPVALLAAIGILSTALMRSDLEHRDEVVLDQLTGMLNRRALDRRAAELEQQSRVTGDPVAVIVGDLDHFKEVNDTRGHAVGDAVLRDVAYTIRKRLRAFDFAYRIGGEEFLILVPGADKEVAATLAEAVRDDLEGSKFSGVSVSMSFGVGATEYGEPLDYQAVFCRADQALYEAKRAGRNRVVVDRGGELAAAPVPTPA